MKSRWVWFGGFSALFAGAMTYVFWGTWSPDVTFIQPDCGITYPAGFMARKWREFCGGGALVPWELHKLLGGPYVWQELQYAVSMYLAALGVVYYLKGRGLPPLACYGAGAAYGFMGYNFTLFSAGHLGWFELLTCAPFCFGLIDRCIRKGKWLNWVLLGGLLAWGGVHQPDIWLLFTVFAFAYGLFRLLHASVLEKNRSSRSRFVVRTLLGVLVTAVVLVSAGWPQLYSAIFVQTANRDKQIEESTGGAKKASGDDASAVESREKRYVFCTNWSLPPDETLEFMIPNIKGASSDVRITPSNRYRGRIGMQVAPGRWAPYRQHSLYMGFLTVCFAVLGMLGVRRRRDDADGSLSAGANNRSEIVFWTASAAVLLLVAFGGFTPFYRLVFMLPVGDYIRCPVKFVHLVEWCVAVLAGFGVASLLSFRFMRRIPAVAAAVVASLLVVNMFNLVAEDARYCAVDPSDTIRIAIAKETGGASLGFAMDANSKWGADEYILAGGTAFRDNNRLKDALSKGAYAPVSFWNFQNGRFLKTSRERAGFALLKCAKPAPRPEKGSSVPCASAVVSLLASCVVCLAGVLKLVRIRKN